MSERLYNVITKEYTFLVKWDESTITELTVTAESETAAKMKIELMASVAGFEILDRPENQNDR